MHCLRISELEELASALVRGTTRELYLTPKPGLVDRADSGSHPDLSLPIMEQSIGYVAIPRAATLDGIHDMDIPF